MNTMTLTDPSIDLEQICKNAATSSSEKDCSVKNDFSGCEEIDKEPEVPEPKPVSDDGNTSDAESENNNPSGNNNSCGRNYLNKIIIFIAICLLF